MTMTRLRDVRLIPLVFGPLVGALAVLETELDGFFGSAAAATRISGVAMGAGLMVAAWHPLAARSSRPSACRWAWSCSTLRESAARR
nr:hypothetical protein GCM10020093_053510 [Planobispora longispora]